jgi:hypothetical protein
LIPCGSSEHECCHLCSAKDCDKKRRSGSIRRTDCFVERFNANTISNLSGFADVKRSLTPT